ncbi:CorA family divalent cation transporter [Nakamurella alba]|uniref:CorA family divalent cation transporter n=1 Tax=Nakamurella alba TaxID=2665158 RepID=UPI0018ABA9BB|nr:CorA family divalent cation transporter [Nakamurella alba]
MTSTRTDGSGSTSSGSTSSGNTSSGSSVTGGGDSASGSGTGTGTGTANGGATTGNGADDVTGSAAGPDFRAFLWRDGAVLDEHPSQPTVASTLRADHTAMAWALLPREQTGALASAVDFLQVDALGVEDVLGDDESVKLDWVGGTMVAVLPHHVFDAATGDLTKTRVSILAGPRTVVLLVDPDVADDLEKHLRSGTDAVLTDGVPAVLHMIIDRLVDDDTAVLAEMEDAVDELSDQLFDDRPLGKQEQLTAFRLRRSVTRFRRVAVPLRSITSDLATAAARRDGDDPTDAAETLLGTRSAREFADVADHAAHNAGGADAMREVLASVYETNLSLADVRLNTVMKKLAGWAAIIAVPTFVTGFMGMNVPYPGYGTTTGVVVSVVVVLVAVLVLYLLFRRKGWL